MVLVGLLVDVVADAVVDVAVDRPKEEQAEDVPKADGISKELPNSLLLETLLGGLAPWRGNVLGKIFVGNSVLHKLLIEICLTKNKDYKWDKYCGISLFKFSSLPAG